MDKKLCRYRGGSTINVKPALITAVVTVLSCLNVSANVFEPETLYVTSDTGARNMTIYAPDFAYPRDVEATAKAFLETHPASVYAEKGSERLLAIEELSYASLLIDRASTAEVVSSLLKLSREETDESTRAMLLAYIARICRTQRIRTSGYLPTPVPGREEHWSYNAYGLAADSLYNLAYETAPADAPIAPFAAALTPLDPGIRLISTVRDFILFRWTAQFSDVNEKARRYTENLTPGSPLWFYFNILELNKGDAQLEFLRSHIDDPNVVYGVIPFLEGGKGYLGEDVHRFLVDYAKTQVPTWYRKTLSETIVNQMAPRWVISIPGPLAAGIPFSLTTSSRNTDTIKFDVYRLANPTDELTENNLKDAEKLEPWLISPRSGFTELTDTVRMTLPMGSYYIETEGDGKKISAVFSVMPWKISIMEYAPGKFMLQVLDYDSGRGVRDIKVSRETSRSKKKSVGKTDTEGTVCFNAGDEIWEGNLYLSDPATGCEITVRCGVYFYPNKRGRTENPNPVRITLTTDRPVYQPGDTVRWEAVARRDETTVEGFRTTFKVRVPQDRKELKDLCDTVVGPTDSFGRCHGEFVIPEATIPGMGLILTEENVSYFSIVEFKLPEIKISDNKYSFEGDSVIISGMVLNSADSPRPDTMVKLSAKNENDSTAVFFSTTDFDGRYSFKINRHLWQNANQSDMYSFIDYTVEAFGSDGYTAETSDSFPEYLDVELEIKAQDICEVGKGLRFKIIAERYGMEDAGEAVECQWKLEWSEEFRPGLYRREKVMEGEAFSGEVTLPAAMVDTLRPGMYYLTVSATGLKSDTASRKLTLYNTDSTELPDKNVAVWLPEKRLKADGSHKASLTVGSSQPRTVLWYTNGKSLRNGKLELKNTTLEQGFQTVTFDAEPGDTLFVWSVRRGKYASYMLPIEKEISKDTLSLSLESFRDNVRAGGSEKWRFVTRLNGSPVSAALSVSVFDNRLLMFGNRNRLSLRPIFLDQFYKKRLWATIPRDYSQSLPCFPSHKILSADLTKYLFPDWKYLPPIYDLQSYGIYGARSMGSVVGYGTLNDEVVVTQMARTKSNFSEVVESASVDDAEDLTAAMNFIQVRENESFGVLWRPMLTTDSLTGTADIDFIAPDQPATWRLEATAWTTDLKSAELTKTFVATKPLSVKPNLPRFVRVGDIVNIVTAITNTTDSAKTVTYDVTAGADTIVGVTDIASKGVVYVNTNVAIDGRVALNDVLVFTFRATDGTYGDGERVTVPVLPSSALVTESNPFYINPSDRVFTTTLPRCDNSDDVTELHYTSNPMWTIFESVSELLGTAEELQSVSTAYAQSRYIAQTALRIATDHPVAAEVINVGGAKSLLVSSLENLKKLQKSDGGFSWGSWSSESSFGTTLDVLSWIDPDDDNTDLKKMVSAALVYLDSNVVPKGRKPGVDMKYALYRTAFGNPSTLEGRDVVNNTVNHVVRNWKSMSTADKCLGAILLARNGYVSVARTILGSVEQFGVNTADRGMVFPNMSGVVSYARLLEAFHAVSPDDKTVDAVRQALICQRRGYAWGSNAHTAYAVRALIETGTDWVVPSGPVGVFVDGKRINIPLADLRTGAFSVEVSGDTLTVSRSASVPAYGAVVSRRIVSLADVPAYGAPGLTIEKNMYVADNHGNRTLLEDTDVVPGTKVIVSMRLSCDADMSDIIVTDNRSATLEPSLVKGRYLRSSSGAWFFVQNRNKWTDIYIDRLPRGYTTVEYEAVINNSGTFTTGVATVTSSVDPDLTAHSSSRPFTVLQRQ